MNKNIKNTIIKYKQKVKNGHDPSSNNNEDLIYACKVNNLKLVRLILKYKRTNPSANNNEALILAIKKSNISLVKFLLSDNRLIIPSNFYEAIGSACLEKNLEIIQLFLDDYRIKLTNKIYTIFPYINYDIKIKVLIDTEIRKNIISNLTDKVSS